MATATASEVAAALTVEFSAHGKKKSNSAFAVLALKDVHVKQGHNPRRNIGDLTELESGVKREGLINPITVRPQSGKDAKEGRYWIVAGERRYRAVKALGYDSIPAVIRFDLENDEDARLVAVCENGDGRTDLTHAELGYAFKEALGAGLKPGEIASRTGMNHMKVRRCLDLIEAPEKIQKKVESGELSLMAGLEYAAMEDDSLRKTVERRTRCGVRSKPRQVRRPAVRIRPSSARLRW
jgi:ParB family chromosome partitioning protein